MEIGDTVYIYPSCPEKHWVGEVTEIFERTPSRKGQVVEVTHIETGFKTVICSCTVEYRNGEYHTKRPPPDKEKKICEIEKQIDKNNFKCSEHGCEACSNDTEFNRLFDELKKIYDSIRGAL